MIKGMGIDIVELKRIEAIVTRQPTFVERILTEKEQRIYNQLNAKKRKQEFLAGRFAAKEAFSKANGTGIGKLSFLDMEILPNKDGAPILSATTLKGDKCFVSISHSDEYAIAQVIIQMESAY